MSQLDLPETRSQYDREDMLGRIYELPDQCRKAWDSAMAFDIAADLTQVRNVLVLGMGGSAIGGDLVRSLTAREMRLPLTVVRDYDVPGFAGPDTLVVASSHSGNTEETLSAFQQARDRGAKLIAISTGGKLKDLAAEWGIPHLQFHYPAQPRASLGYSAVLLLGLLQKLGFVGDKSADVAEAVSVLAEQKSQLGADVPALGNPAKALAQAVYRRLPVLYGAGILSEVARRWKGQFNENSKSWGFFEQLPELNHNAVVGFENPEDMKERVLVIFLQSAFDHPRVQIRQTVTQDILARVGVPVEVIQARGSSAFAQQMSAVYIGDFVSYYLALLYQSDPTPVRAIDYLKQQLAMAGQN